MSSTPPSTSLVNPQRLERFHNRHRGERVFLIGNGPSLSARDLDLIRGQPSFAMNRIAMIYPHTEWRPTYFVCVTLNVQRPDWNRDIMASVDLGIDTFAWEAYSEHFGDRDVHYVRCSHGTELTPVADPDWWSDDIADRVCKFGTSMLAAIQIAAYMGFSELCLLGCDLGFRDGDPGADPNHFDPNYGTPGFDSTSLNMNMLAAHRLALAALTGRGVRIVNATRGGFLDVFERCSLESLLAR